jgi:Zn finger protein HypA/HybF involved in hydrogenase expression
MNKYWSKEEFETVVKNAKTIKEVLRHFGLPSNQGHYNRMFHKYVKEFNIDITHIMNSVKSQEFRKPIPIEELFIKGKHREGRSLKKRLIKEGFAKDECSVCGQTNEWNNKPLVLQLDHINGDNTDNRVENLRVICPNCHSQTSTWSGRNAQEKHAHKYVCKTCGGPKKYTKSKNCKKCERLSRRGNTKIVWPPKETILQMTEEIGFSATGRKLGVSDNAVRKFLRKQ